MEDNNRLRHLKNRIWGSKLRNAPIIVAIETRSRADREIQMHKFSCNMISGEEIFYATLIAEDARQAKEMAATETKKGRPREWNVAVIETDVPGPARFLGTGVQEA